MLLMLLFLPLSFLSISDNSAVEIAAGAWMGKKVLLLESPSSMTRVEVSTLMLGT